VIELFSRDHGSHQPAISLYLNVAATDFALRGRHSRLERVRIGANLRHARYDSLNEAFESGATAGLAYEDELRTLWQLALALERARGRPSVNAGIVDYAFRVEAGRVAIEPRRRGAPLDKLVSELMILANTTWGELLAERDIAAIYRVQSSGKVRLSVHPESHEGLGVSCYAWMSSPLRRYVDLINQWQLAAALGARRAPFTRTSEGLLAALRAFEVTYARYDEHQRAMETYWCLRWLQQEGVTETDATVLRENVVRFDRLPLTVRVPSLPDLEPGARVRLAVQEIDFLERSANCVWRDTLGRSSVPLEAAGGQGVP
jgi:exoribonuclease-2